MAKTSSRAIFSLQDVQAAAMELMQLNLDPIPKFRLMREVLRLPDGDLDLQEASACTEESKWVMKLQEAQLPDGSWGRFHSQDSKVKGAYRTSEEAMDRAFSLGLSPAHPVLHKAQTYIENVLSGKSEISDWVEKNEAWPLLIQFILAGRLAQIDPRNLILDESWECLAEVTRRAFAAGCYQLADEAEAFEEIAHTHVPQGFIESQHALWILSSRRMPSTLERQLVEWVWLKPDGIRYLRAPLSTPTSKTIAYWLRSMNILRRFGSWREVSLETLNQLWKCRGVDGLWDFGSQATWCTDFPLSENWRKQLKRKVDYSVCMLGVLRSYFD